MKMLGLPNHPATTSKDTFGEMNKERAEEGETSQATSKPGNPPPNKSFRQARRDAQRAREQEIMMKHQLGPGPNGKASEGSSPNSSDVHLPNGSVKGADSGWIKSESGWSRVKPVENLQRKAPATWVDDVPTTFQPRTRSPSRERRPPPQAYRNGPDSQTSSHPALRGRAGSDRNHEEPGRGLREAGSYSNLQPHEEHPATRPPARSPITPNSQFQPSPGFPPVNVPTGRNRSNSRSPGLGYPEASLQQANGQTWENGTSPRPSPMAPFSINPTPPQVSPNVSTANTPTNQGFQSEVRVPTGRKKSVNKSTISEPILISSTSRVTTVDLPPGASLQNGADAPPIPPVNPRRRQTRTMFGGFAKKDEAITPIPSPNPDDGSNFSTDEIDYPVASQQQLRKAASEGTALNSRARPMMTDAPMPSYAPPSRSPPRAMEGGMF